MRYEKDASDGTTGGSEGVVHSCRLQFLDELRVRTGLCIDLVVHRGGDLGIGIRHGPGDLAGADDGGLYELGCDVCLEFAVIKLIGRRANGPEDELLEEIEQEQGDDDVSNGIP